MEKELQVTEAPSRVYERPFACLIEGAKIGDKIGLLQSMLKRVGILLVGGGSTAEVVQEMGLTQKVTHVSTGGGASLKFLEGISLLGVEVSPDKNTWN